VNGPKAAALVFPPDQYDLYFSGRYVEDLVTGKATDPDPEQRSDRIYTGFAVRRGVFDAVSKRDVPSLGLIHAADNRPVRWGTEILLEKDGQLLRLLSVHLKSGGHGGSLENPADPNCVTLAAQLSPLEAWIDEAAQELVPFVILGDWNRRIDRFGQDDHLWREIDDGDPPGLDLRRLPFDREAECNPAFPQPIDFLVFDDRAWQMVDEASFQEITYDSEDQDPERGTPSDHCSIAVSLELTAEEDGDDDEPSDTTDLDQLYAPAAGLEGEALKSVLHEIAERGHSPLSYAEVWGALDFTDEDPDNTDNVILLYTGRSHPKPDKVSSTLNPGHNDDSWNREHVWPKSHGFPSEGLRGRPQCRRRRRARSRADRRGQQQRTIARPSLHAAGLERGGSGRRPRAPATPAHRRGAGQPQPVRRSPGICSRNLGDRVRHELGGSCSCLLSKNLPSLLTTISGPRSAPYAAIAIRNPVAPFPGRLPTGYCWPPGRWSWRSGKGR
jgi:hypothetical protein